MSKNICNGLHGAHVYTGNSTLVLLLFLYMAKTISNKFSARGFESVLRLSKDAGKSPAVIKFWEDLR